MGTPRLGTEWGAGVYDGLFRRYFMDSSWIGILLVVMYCLRFLRSVGYRECGGVLRGDLLRVSHRVLYLSIVGAKT